jgi:hypothetical protein
LVDISASALASQFEKKSVVSESTQQPTPGEPMAVKEKRLKLLRTEQLEVFRLSQEDFIALANGRGGGNGDQVIKRDVKDQRY